MTSLNPTIAFVCAALIAGTISPADGQTLQPATQVDNQSGDSSSIDQFQTNQTNKQLTSPTTGLKSAGRTAEEKPYRISGRFHMQKGTNKGYLVLEIDMRKGSYVHSLTQAGELRPSVIKVNPSFGFTTIGDFTSDRPPTVIEKDPVFQQRVEKHKDKVQFFVPIELAENVDVSALQPELVFDGQVCTNQNICMPLRNKTVRASFAGYFERTSQKRESSQNPQSK